MAQRTLTEAEREANRKKAKKASEETARAEAKGAREGEGGLAGAAEAAKKQSAAAKSSSDMPKQNPGESLSAYMERVRKWREERRTAGDQSKALKEKR